MKSFLLVLVSTLLLSWIASEANAQYFSASDGATVGRIGRRSDPSTSQHHVKSSQQASETLKKILSNGRYSSHAKRSNDLGLLNFDDESSLAVQPSDSESEQIHLREDRLKEYLLKFLISEYLNN